MNAELKPLTLVELLRGRAAGQSDQVAYRFLSDGETEDTRVTYGELDRQAQAIAVRLQSIGLEKGDTAILLYPPGLEFISAYFGCLYAGVVAVTAYPPRNNRNLLRLQVIVSDARAKAALTTERLVAKIQSQFSHDAHMNALDVLATDVNEPGIEERWQDPGVTASTLAFLQYTSGSTGDPKGVMVTHGNLIHNSEVISIAGGYTRDTIGISWLPTFHDLGLMAGVLQPMYVGFPAVLMPPAAFLQRPIRWLQAISRWRGTTSYAPNFAYEMCAHKVNAEELASLDLSSWRVAINAAEPIRAQTLDRFTEVFGPCGFRREAMIPAYGLAEATLAVTVGMVDAGPTVKLLGKADLEQRRAVPTADPEKDAVRVVGCGMANRHHRIVIVDPDTCAACTPNRVGEIWIKSPSVAQGYWERPAATASTFGARVADTDEGPFLRTGDLGFVDEAGDLYITGRLKDLIIIRGRNIYPQDVETTVVQSHPAFRPDCGAAFSVEVGGEEHLVVVQEVDRRARGYEEMVTAVRRAISQEYEVRVHAVVLIRTATLPKTSSGKIQRRTCQKEFLTGELEGVWEWREEPGSDDASGELGDTEAGSPATGPSKTAAQLQEWLVGAVAKHLRMVPQSVGIRVPFSDYGIDSVQAVSVVADLGTWLGRSLPETLLWDYPTIREMADHLSGEASAPLRPASEQPTANEEPIAIVGMSCRFPGAPDLDAFWQLLSSGKDAVTEVPSDRWNIDELFDATPGTPGKMSSRWGGFLEQIDQFDPEFFGLSPREAASMDPQQRFMLEVAWEALENAGLPPGGLSGSPMGVFVGISSVDYSRQVFSHRAAIDAYSSTGTALSIAANRISYLLDLKGPSFAVDTACSSSLVAVHLACQSLRNGECTTALAGGVNVILTPDLAINFSMIGAMAPDGRCKTFDSRADGYVRSEGAGAIVLKPLSRALADGDRIYAVIRGSAVNQDGRSNGMTAPNGTAQENVLREAYRRAGILPGQVHYVEAHGTGTPLGDPIEARALGTVLLEGRTDGSRCAIGSVKTNLGHLEAAAGIAGLIKVALSLNRGLLPPSLHFLEPNARIPFDSLPLVVQQHLGPWPVRPGERAVAGVSAFGFGGTNVHAVLEEAPSVVMAQAEHPVRREVFTLSAHTPQALQQLAQAYYKQLTTPELSGALHDICYTAGARRNHFAHRLAVVSDSNATLADHLQAFLQQKHKRALFTGQAQQRGGPKVAFVFSGHGSHWAGMGLDLLDREPVFRAKLEACEALFRQHAGWSLLNEMRAGEASPRAREIEVIQATVFAVQVALADLWRSWGVQPDAVLGHSMGEVAAAHVAGVLTLEEAIRLIICRSRLLGRVAGVGKMMAAKLSLDEALAALAGGYEDRVSIAAVNSHRSVVFSGQSEAVEALMKSLKEGGVACQLLQADGAGHSPYVEPFRAELEHALADLQPREAHATFVSTVTGAPLVGTALHSAYWGRNLRETVMFGSAIAHLAQNGYDAFLEVSPHPAVAGPIREGLRGVDRDILILGSLKRQEDSREAMLSSLAELYAIGQTVSWSELYPTGHVVTLPSYAWQRERHWVDTSTAEQEHGYRAPGFIADGTGTHPLLGRRLTLAVPGKEQVWETAISHDRPLWLRDHQVRGKAVVPAAAYIEMALAAAEAVFGEGARQIDDLTFSEALMLLPEDSRVVQLVLSPVSYGEAVFKIFSRPADIESQEAWTMHASGKVRLDHVPESRTCAALTEIQAGCTEEVAVADHYQRVTESGGHYGETFRGIRRLWRRHGEALGQVETVSSVVADAAAYQIHPALLDASLQVLWQALPAMQQGSLYLPVGAERVCVYGPVPTTLWSHATLRSVMGPFADRHTGDIRLLDADGKLVAAILGLRIQRTDEHASDSVYDWLYQTEWHAQDLGQPAPAKEPSQPEVWLVLADQSSVGQALVAQLQARGATCVVVTPGAEFTRTDAWHYQINLAEPAHFRRLVDEVMAQQPCHGIVHLWTLDAPPAPVPSLADLEEGQMPGCISTLHLVQAMASRGETTAPRLWLITQGATSQGAPGAPVSVTQAPMWGLGRTIAQEHPELRCTLVDFHADVETLCAELQADEREDQVVLRPGARYVARLVRCTAEALEQRRLAKAQAIEAPSDQAFMVDVTTRGILDSLTVRAVPRHTPGPGEVEVEVYATGLNFKDVMNVMGLVSEQFGERGRLLGMECAGRISAVGSGVKNWSVGDEVITVVGNCLGRYAITNANLVVRKPSNLPFDEAATILVAFLTVFFSFYQIGGLRRGERILIHSAAGGVGLAAVQVALRAGLEIFATAGSPEKRAYLKSLGVHHVMDSRSLAWAEEVKALTTGQGVDVILNALPGEAITKGLEVLSSYGRFVEIGKTDIINNRQIGLYPFRNNLSYFAVDLSDACQSRQDLIGPMLREIMAGIEDGSLKPLPFVTFPLQDVVGAFRHIAQRKNIGKVIVSLQDAAVALPPTPPPVAIKADVTYMVTGGLTGLGLLTAHWLVEKGARHLLLLGRRAPSSEAQGALAAMRAVGAEVRVASVDIANQDQVAGLLAEIRQVMPPLRGIVHSAGLLDDGTLLQLDATRFLNPMRPKVAGAWNLHTLTVDMNLDFFVLYSSAASTLGSPGQSNYAAANGFLDGLCHYRQALGLPALTINWGPWAEVGGAARSDRGGRLANRGLRSISAQKGVKVLELLLREDPGQMTVLPMEWYLYLDAYQGGSVPPLLSIVASEAIREPGAAREGTPATQIRSELLSATAGERQVLLESYLQTRISKLLGLPVSKLGKQLSLNRLGLDSLVAIELKNRIQTELGVVLPLVKLMQGHCIEQLAADLLDQIEAPTEGDALVTIVPEPMSDKVTHGQAEQLLAKLDELSDEEVAVLLEEMLPGEGT